MKVLFVGAKEVDQLLPMAECIGVMEKTLRQMARGGATFPPRSVMPLPGGIGVLGLMPGNIGAEELMGLKAVSVFPSNEGTPYESHQGAVLVFETQHGSLRGVVDAGSITRIRTAAVSGVATDILARKDVRELAILGSGTQAISHLEAMLEVRPSLEKVRVHSRNPANAKAFAARESSDRKLDVQAVNEAKDAVKGADIICTTTASRTPVLLGSWMDPGIHVNAIGASRQPSRELDTEAIVRSRFYVDSRQSAYLESSDFLVPKSEGAIQESHLIGEIGEVLERKVEGRLKPEDITVFKSLGLAIEDLAAAQSVCAKASSTGAGTWIDFGSERRLPT
ncbi:MAG TPA: ornithine cyclodeaminase family protein [Nitrososphaerales archaeon]|nr:ornithine cyclodeaminase family protein [Nitrososphaerales archaeon]